MLIINEKEFVNKPTFAEGGEAILYEHQGYLCKIYNNTVNKQEKLDKIKKLISLNLPVNVIKPSDLICNEKRQFVGFTMKKIVAEEFKRLSVKKYIKTNRLTIKNIVKMLINIKDTIKLIHQQGIVIGDLNDSNILFDYDYNVYFIDVDSWSVGENKCTVCMDIFKDPKLISNHFTNETDYYALSVLIFKTLTKIHPFGGVTEPDMTLSERMLKKISVINNPKVKIPKTIQNWDFINPELISDLKKTFEHDARFLIDKNLNNFYQSLKFCKVHNDYYYGVYSNCPICNANVTLIQKPIKEHTVIGIPYKVIFKKNDVSIMLNEDLYLNNDNEIVHIKSGCKIANVKNRRFYFSDNGEILYQVSPEDIKINYKKQEYTFEKYLNSKVVVKDNIIYFCNKNNLLMKLTITDKGNHIDKITNATNKKKYNIIDNFNFCITNFYYDKVIVNINHYVCNLSVQNKITNSAIHFDSQTKRWLFIIEDSKGIFTTFIFEKNNLIYQTDKIKYLGNISNICFDNNIIYRAGDKKIIGYSFEKNIYKDFECFIINEDAKLIKEKNKFIVMNEQEMYIIG